MKRNGRKNLIFSQNYEKFSNDINSQNITYKALETTNNLIVYIIKDLYM